MRYGAVALPWYLSRELLSGSEYAASLPAIGPVYADMMAQVDVDLGAFAKDLGACKGRYSKIIVSSEDFTCFPYALFFPNAISEKQNRALRGSFIRRCRDYFSAFDDIKVIVSVRRQDQYIESGYNQVVSGPLCYQGTVDQLIDFHACALDYADCLLAWAEHFGLENILLMPFETEAMPFGPLKAFLQKIDPDVDPSTYKSGDIHANYSASAELLSNKLYYNRFVREHLNDAQRGIVQAYFEKQIKIEKRSRVSLLTHEDREKILYRFIDSNEKTAGTFLTKNYGPLFREPVGNGLKERLPHLYRADVPGEWDVDLPEILSKPPKNKRSKRREPKRWKKRLIQIFHRLIVDRSHQRPRGGGSRTSIH
jgi:hypothetical protein